MEENIITTTKRRVVRECEIHGIVPDSIDLEYVYQRGNRTGYTIRCFFRREFDAIFTLCENILRALTGFGKIVHRLNNDGDEDEAVLEISFKF